MAIFCSSFPPPKVSTPTPVKDYSVSLRVSYTIPVIGLGYVTPYHQIGALEK